MPTIPSKKNKKMNEYPILTVLVVIALIILNVYILRAVFEIPRIVDHMKLQSRHTIAQTNLLATIAESNKVDSDTIQEILDEIEPQYTWHSHIEEKEA